jgi:hypothetical protein
MTHEWTKFDVMSHGLSSLDLFVFYFFLWRTHAPSSCVAFSKTCVQLSLPKVYLLGVKKLSSRHE